MSLIFSKTCEYALQSVLYMSSKQPDQPSLQKEIANNLHIPQNFLGKILQRLAYHKIVHSRKGKHGGFLLNKPADKITLLEVVKAIDGDEFLSYCVIGFPQCEDSVPCPLHDRWSKIKKEILSLLVDESVADFGKELKPKLASIQKRLGKH